MNGANTALNYWSVHLLPCESIISVNNDAIEIDASCAQPLYM